MSAVPPAPPPFQSDLFGNKYVGANHGRMLLASSAASLSGPAILLWLRGISEHKAVDDLLRVIDPARFHSLFGVDMSHAQQLIEVCTGCLCVSCWGLPWV